MSKIKVTDSNGVNTFHDADSFDVVDEILYIFKGGKSVAAYFSWYSVTTIEEDIGFPFTPPNYPPPSVPVYPNPAFPTTTPLHPWQEPFSWTTVTYSNTCGRKPTYLEGGACTYPAGHLGACG